MAQRYAYRYWQSVDDWWQEPLSACPECKHPLTGEGGVQLELTDGQRVWTQDSQLLADGTLDDPHGMVAAGLHSGTRCGGYDNLLLNMDGVEEEQRDPDKEDGAVA